MKPATVVAIIGSLVVVFAAVNLSFNMQVGSLSRPPIYDDAVYLLDAYQRLAFGDINSLATVVGSFFAAPPHAPMSTLTGMLGFVLLGPSVWSAYAASIWLLAAFAGATYAVARLNVDQFSSIALTALMLFVPNAHALISEFRPDPGASVVFGAALVGLLCIDYTRATKLQRSALAFLVVCAVVAKPSAFIATVPALGLATLLGVFRPGFYSRSQMASSARAAVLPLAVAIALAIPCLVIWGDHAIRYVYQVLVIDADMWAVGLGPWFHWTFNSFGDGGKRALGAFLWLGLISIAVDVIFSLRPPLKRGSYDALALYVIVVVLYCSIAAFSQKSIYQGSFFYFPFLFATTLSLGRNLARIGTQAQRAVPVVLLAAAAIFMPPASTYQQVAKYQNSGPILTSISNAVANEISAWRSGGCVADRFKIAAMDVWPVTLEAVVLSLAMNFRVNATPINWLTNVRTAEEMDSEVDVADFVILSKGDKVPHLPGAQFSSHTSARLTSRPEWHLISSGREFELFARTGCR